jgi:hypothetical protein
MLCALRQNIHEKRPMTEKESQNRYNDAVFETNFTVVLFFVEDGNIKFYMLNTLI